MAAVVVAIAFGLYRRFSDGRFGQGREDVAAPESVLADTPWHSELGERATLLQFSSAFCAPCRATRRVLDDVATITPGVSHVEVDAEQHLEVVRRLGILRTPTTLVLDADGVERVRASGAARKEQVLAALADVV